MPAPDLNLGPPAGKIFLKLASELSADGAARQGKRSFQSLQTHHKACQDFLKGCMDVAEKAKSNFTEAELSLKMAQENVVSANRRFAEIGVALSAAAKALAQDELAVKRERAAAAKAQDELAAKRARPQHGFLVPKPTPRERSQVLPLFVEAMPRVTKAWEPRQRQADPTKAMCKPEGDPSVLPLLAPNLRPKVPSLAWRAQCP